jgi:peptidoglycan/LPS O-acetylase OafA/YrhL
MPRCLPVLAAQPVALIGRASYLYYLLHQSFGIALLTGLGLGAPGPAIAAMLGVQAGILALSVGLHVWVEVPVMRRLRRRLADVEHPGGDAR